MCFRLRADGTSAGLSAEGLVCLDDFGKIFLAATEEGFEFRVLVELAYRLGWRKGELLNLHVSNVRLLENQIRLEAYETKTNEARVVALDEGLRTLLEPLCIGRVQDERLFSFRDISRAWVRITKAAGCPHILFHDLRRSSAKSKREAGIDTSVIMRMQGWATDTTFRRYAIVAPNDTAQALQKQREYEQWQLAKAAELRRTPISYKTVTTSSRSACMTGNMK